MYDAWGLFMKKEWFELQFALSVCLPTKNVGLVEHAGFFTLGVMLDSQRTLRRGVLLCPVEAVLCSSGKRSPCSTTILGAW